ncbi:MAG: signal peptidase II [Acidimicrobiales bacterium]
MLKRPVPLAATVAVIVAVIDQITKRWAVERLTAGPCAPDTDACIDLFWTLRLHLHFNPGAAFSTGAGLGPLFGVLAFAMVMVLFNLARSRDDLLGPILLGSIAGGAIGNLTDRVLRAEDGLLSGTVVDFIDLQWWPIFNIADAAVVVGVIGYIAYSLLRPEQRSSDVAAIAADSEAPPRYEPDRSDGSDDEDDPGERAVGEAERPDRTPSGG